ncbi:hypothetical protein AK830_g5822 [Neonectria ditissima]|uniref:Transcription factor domain-containing protein n=1 Tax=Neonectria ditissima TaxID=78410 RepID=A0A0P7BK18_9HYPO|nr:hypothetical protein AK830_g5822 [Neonectria ditissima]
MESIAQDLTAASAEDQISPRLEHVSTSNTPLRRRDSNPTRAVVEKAPLPDRSFASSQTPQDKSSPSATTSQHPSLMIPRSEVDMGFITGYMGYVFPAIFPFYRPSILYGGRTWLLVLAMRNDGFFNTIVSLSSYYFSVVPVAPSHPDHPICVSNTWKELQKKMYLALASVQDDLKDVGRRGLGECLQDSVNLLANIGQLLNFEIAIPSGNWQIHLDAATGLFDQMIQYHARTGHLRGVRAVLDKLSSVSSTRMTIPTSPIQGAFQFFSTVLLINDIISSTSLSRVPRLNAHHHELVQADGPDKELPTLRIEEVIGCQAWVLLVISDIATLDAWKKGHLESLHQVEAELLSRATSIEKRIQEGRMRLDKDDLLHNGQLTCDQKPNQQSQVYLERSNYSNDLSPLVPQLHTQITRIWAHAAHSYLLVVLLGWQPEDTRIRSNTASTIDIFNKMSSHDWLRSVVWPFCMSGCLALDGQRQTFSRIGNSTEAFQTFGTVREAMKIMENVWGQTEIDVSSWDIGACLKSSGHSALLV